MCSCNNNGAFAVRGFDLLSVICPADGCAYSVVPSVSGRGTPGTAVCVRIDDHPPLTTTVEPNGTWSVDNPYPLADGLHNISARDNFFGGTGVYVMICGSGLLAAPLVTYPTNGAVITRVNPTFSGCAYPGNTVTVCIEGYGCNTGIADDCGRFAIFFTTTLPSGAYSATITQTDSDGRVSIPATVFFTVAGIPIPLSN